MSPATSCWSVVTDEGDDPAPASIDRVTRELTERELEEAVLRDELVVTVRVFEGRMMPWFRVGPVAPTTFHVSSRFGPIEGHLGELVRSLVRWLDAAGTPYTRPALESLSTLDDLLSAEAGGSIARTRLPRRKRPELPTRTPFDPRSPEGRAMYSLRLERPTRLLRELRRAERARRKALERARQEESAEQRAIREADEQACKQQAERQRLAAKEQWLQDERAKIEDGERARRAVLDDLDITVFSPAEAVLGDSILIQVFAHLQRGEDEQHRSQL